MIPTSALSHPERPVPDAPPAANAALLLAAFSLIPMLGIVFSISAIYLGMTALGRIDAEDGMLRGAGKGRSVAAIVIGVATAALWISLCRGC